VRTYIFKDIDLELQNDSGKTIVIPSLAKVDESNGLLKKIHIKNLRKDAIEQYLTQFNEVPISNKDRRRDSVTSSVNSAPQC
jgi:hypothetical protein